MAGNHSTQSTDFRIGQRAVGPDQPPLVIAEIGINHNGSLPVAKEMVDAAHRAGIEVVKHQTHIVQDEMSAAARQVIPGNADRSIYEIMEACSLSEQDERALMQYVQSLGMIFISTPFSRAAVDRLVSFDVPAFKIGSGECNNFPLVEYIGTKGKPVILSTGMNNMDDVRTSVDILRSAGVPVAVMHTTNLYPTPVHLVRLGAMTQLAESFPELPVGLSDHTTSNRACFAATALGASILERHFTDRMDREGPDIVNSMDEQAARELIQGSHEIWQMRGGSKEAAAEEQVTIDFAFASVVTLSEIAAGEPLTRENIWVKRPGTGEIHARHYNDLIGRRLTRSVKADEHLAWTDVADQ